MNLHETWAEAAKVLSGALTLPGGGSAEEPLGRLSIDSRTLQGGEAFCALKGPRFDAHEFLDAGLAKRTSGWIAQAGRPRGKVKPRRLIEVPDTLKALQTLAAYHRRRFEIPVAAITGSNGKTTTKEMLRAICAELGPVCASPGNYNNQVGLPLSVLELTSEHRYAVLELADSKPGDIEELSRIARPSVSVITNIGADHLEFYGGELKANFQTKAEILTHAQPDSPVILNADDPFLAPLAASLGPRALTFGSAASTARVRWILPSALMIDRRHMELKLKGFGDLLLQNAACAAAGALALGIPPDTIRSGLERFSPPPMRLERLRARASGVEIVLDAYNANPSSMRAAIAAFLAEFPEKEKVLALGDMKELGADSPRYHEELGAWLKTLPLKAVYLAGPEMEPASKALSGAAFPCAYAPRAAAWLESLKRSLGSRSAVFLKASRAMRFEEIAREIAG